MLAAIATLLSPVEAALAQDASGAQSLDQAANDPTASIMSLQLADWYTPTYHHLDDSDNAIALRAAIPFELGGIDNIFRITAPIITDHPALEPGLGDITIFDLMVFNENWGRWGVGAVALLPTGGDHRGADQWALGPALGFTAPVSDDLLVGLFNQNLFHIGGDQALGQADVNVSTFQPILSHKLGGGWSVGFSEMQIAYDWEDGRFSSLPLGIQVSKLQKFGDLPVQFSLQYEHNFADSQVAPSDTIRATVKFLFASK
ncbi:hypothetical protein [Ensifer sp. LC163]|uniref:hypothetical protein n=1 Tax=Ensifer sp. LC163 TaxID=1120652 RepID=UPI000813D7F7|nr:hypothetical protein [Ensifer sp. LC163]OCP35774.1 hypothetical protein BC360_27195 [Ensifer sp. LC163]